MKKLRVLWICHFSNPEVRDRLPLTGKIKNKYKDGGPWIPNLASALENHNEVELHIISPHRGLLKITSSFVLRGVHYYFFKLDIPFLHRMWPSYFALHKWTRYLFNRFIVHRLIKKIKPDIINLHGAENDYYSSTILGIRNIPVIVTIQGIYSNPKRFNSQLKPDKFKIKTERSIHASFKYFGIFPAFFADLIRRDNDSPVLLFQPYLPNLSVKQPIKKNKEFDFVFFARITHVKGIEEILNALVIVKNIFPNVTLNIIGNEGEKNYVKFIKQKINLLKLDENVTFTGQLSTLERVHEEASKARATVIASKFENLPDTIMESIMLNMPVVTTNAGAIPILNRLGKVVFMSKVGDIEAYAENMIQVLKDPDAATEMAEKAKRFVLKEFSTDVMVNRWIEQYQAIHDNFYHDIDIPKHLLFDKKLVEYEY